VGFIAQEVEKIFPDLVAIMGEDGIYALDYAGLIPYLTKAIQEQSKVIQEQGKVIQEQNEKTEHLQRQINEIRNGVHTANFTIDVITNDEKQMVQQTANKAGNNILYQNAPNPFNISTTITYQLADNALNAKICVYNLTGKQLQCYELPATKGENAIEVRASSLQSGMYLYSLIVGDKLIDTKRMILTE
jgi:hypothetical protein